MLNIVFEENTERVNVEVKKGDLEAINRGNVAKKLPGKKNREKCLNRDSKTN
jgi:predicted RecB family endonuclease